MDFFVASLPIKLRIALQLRDIFFTTTTIATYLGLRQAAIQTEDDRFIGYGILGVGIATSTYAALRNCKYTYLFVLPGFTTLFLASSRAMEFVYRLPSTSYLGKDRIQSQYAFDLEINMIGVIVGTAVGTMVAGTIGSTFKLLYKNALKKTRNEPRDGPESPTGRFGNG